MAYPKVKFVAARHSILFLLSNSSNHLRCTLSPRACNSFSLSCNTSCRACLSFAPALLREDKTRLATEELNIRNRLERICKWGCCYRSFFVNGPTYASKRCEPALVIMVFGVEARALLVASLCAKGIACMPGQ